MDEKIVDQILDELFSSFEKSETDSAAILLLLKERGIASEEKLAPFIEQASRTSEVRWRAARVRMGALLKSAMKTPEQPAEQKKTTVNRDQEEKPAEEQKEPAAKEPAEIQQPGEKKADAEPETGSEKTAKPTSGDVSTASESKKPAARATESPRNNPRNNNEEPEKEAKAVAQKSATDSPEKTERK